MTDFQLGMVVGTVVANVIWLLVLAMGNWLSAREFERMERWRRAGIEPSKPWPRRAP